MLWARSSNSSRVRRIAYSPRRSASFRQPKKLKIRMADGGKIAAGRRGRSIEQSPRCLDGAAVDENILVMSDQFPAAALTMRTHVEFRSAKFPAYQGEEVQVNPGLWGKRLGEYLHERLAQNRIAVGGIYAEDWGWAVPLKHDAIPIWIRCGHYQEWEDGYLVSIEPSKPTIRKGLFRKVDTTAEVEKVAAAIDQIVRADPEIRDVRWWKEDER